MNFRAFRHCAEAAVGAGDNILSSDQPSVADQPLGNEVGVLDDDRGDRDHAGHENFSVRQFRRLPQLIFVLVARIGALKGIGAGF